MTNLILLYIELIILLGLQVSDFFTRLIQRVAPKSYQQAHGEVYVTQKFLENFCGDQVDDQSYCTGP